MSEPSTPAFRAKRFMIETSKDNFETVKADRVVFLPSGDVAFYNVPGPDLVVAYPTGTWLSIFDSEEDE